MITYMFLGSLACLAGSLATYAAFLVRLRSYERRLTQTEMHVVRQVMEESPAFVQSVLEAQQRSFFVWTISMEEEINIGGDRGAWFTHIPLGKAEWVSSDLSSPLS